MPHLHASTWQRLLTLSLLIFSALGLGQMQAAPRPAPASPGTAGITSVEPLGPYDLGGRIRAIAVHPGISNFAYTGGVSGGVWKSTLWGELWQPVGDATLPNQAVTAMAIHPLDPNKIYIGTGEGFNTTEVTGVRGDGIFMSPDGGANWQRLAYPADLAADNLKSYYINRLAIAADGSRMLAATNTGLWFSADGGDNWIRTLTYTSTEVLDVEFHPANPYKAIASAWNGRAWHTINSGQTWTEATGLPLLGEYRNEGRLEIAYAPSDPNIVYALADEDPVGRVYRSTDGGISYTRVDLNPNDQNNYLGTQGGFNNLVWVHPDNRNFVVIGGQNLWRSTDGGMNFTAISNGNHTQGDIHHDHHIAVAAPGFSAANPKVYFGNDGGFYIAYNIETVSVGNGWYKHNDYLGITQFHHASADPHTRRVMGGTQDNGTWLYTLATGAWQYLDGSDGGTTAFDPNNANYLYGQRFHFEFHRNTTGGAQPSGYIANPPEANTGGFQTTPFILDPDYPQMLLAGGYALWRTQDVRAPTPAWGMLRPALTGTFPVPTISALTLVSAAQRNTLWVGYTNGDVYTATYSPTLTPTTWAKVDDSSPITSTTCLNLPNLKIGALVAHPFTPTTLYAGIAAFTPKTLYHSRDAGRCWLPLDGASTLNSTPIYALAVHPLIPQWLYLATEKGLYTSEDGGALWTAAATPVHTRFTSLSWVDSTKLVLGSYGRGLWLARLTLPAGVNPTPTGWGLNGRYFNDLAYTPVPTPTLSLVNPAFERIDPQINFYWGGGQVPDPRLTPDGQYGMRWQGYVLPRYTETYTFTVCADDYAKLWVNGQAVALADVHLSGPVCSHGARQGMGTIALTGQRRYPIQLEYAQAGNKAIIELYWASRRQPLELIPSARLYPPYSLFINGVFGRRITLNNPYP